MSTKFYKIVEKL